MIPSVKSSLAQVGVLVVVIAVFSFGLLREQGKQAEQMAAWQKEAKQAVVDARSSQARADSAMQRASKAETDAGTASARADSLTKVADRQAARIAAMRSRIDTVEVPIDALPYTAPRDSVIRLLAEQVDTLTEAVGAERKANTLLRAANADLRTTVTDLSTTVSRLNRVIETAPRDRWYIPVITVGGAAGVDTRTKEFFAGPAVAIGWKVKL